MTWVELWRRSICSISRWKLYEKVPKKKNWQFPWFEEQNSIWQKIQFCQFNFEAICWKKLWGAAKWFYGLLCFVFCFFFVKFARVFRVSVQIHLCSQTFVLAWRSAFYRPARQPMLLLLLRCGALVQNSFCNKIYRVHCKTHFQNLREFDCLHCKLEKKDPLCATSCCWDIVGKNWPTWLMIWMEMWHQLFINQILQIVLFSLRTWESNLNSIHCCMYDYSKVPNKRTIPNLKMAILSWVLFEDILRSVWGHLRQFAVI